MKIHHPRGWAPSARTHCGDLAAPFFHSQCVSPCVSVKKCLPEATEIQCYSVQGLVFRNQPKHLSFSVSMKNSFQRCHSPVIFVQTRIRGCTKKAQRDPLFATAHCRGKLARAAGAGSPLRVVLKGGGAIARPLLHHSLAHLFHDGERCFLSPSPSSTALRLWWWALTGRDAKTNLSQS